MNWLLQSERPRVLPSGHLPAEEQERNGLSLPVAEESLRTLSSMVWQQEKRNVSAQEKRGICPSFAFWFHSVPSGWDGDLHSGGVGGGGFFPGCPESHAHVFHKHLHRTPGKDIYELSRHPSAQLT